MIPLEISRPSKLTHAQTILYEIDMVRFTVASFGGLNNSTAWRNLECFLLHFRNLIEFFGKPTPRQDDLSIKKPETIWSDVTTMPSAEALSRLYREDLWKKYEVRNGNAVKDTISRYLQHCTEERVEPKTWRVREMFEELAPVMSDFENLLPDNSRAWERLDLGRKIQAILQEDASTATVTSGGTLFGSRSIFEKAWRWLIQSLSC